MKKVILTAAVAAALTLPVAASASDGILAGMGQKNVAAAMRYANCGSRSCQLTNVTTFMRSDTAIIKYMTRRVYNGEITKGTACWNYTARLNGTPRLMPWNVGQRWMNGGASDSALLNAQIAWLRTVLNVAKAC